MRQFGAFVRSNDETEKGVNGSSKPATPPPEQLVRTTPLDITAFLRTRGLELIQVDWLNSVVAFIFQASSEFP
jgi:hypothetical protein